MSLSVLIPTYNRADVVKCCIEGLQKHLIYDGPINYHIGIDGNDNTPQLLKDLDATLHTKPSGSLGANINRLVKASSDNFFLQMDDDHILQKPLDLNPHIQAMENNNQMGMIRLWGIAGHNYTATLKVSYWHIDWRSRELYIPSFRPNLKSRLFYETYGMLPEGLKLGETENAWCNQCKDIGIDRLNKWGAGLKLIV